MSSETDTQSVEKDNPSGRGKPSPTEEGKKKEEEKKKYPWGKETGPLSGN